MKPPAADAEVAAAEPPPVVDRVLDAPELAAPLPPHEMALAIDALESALAPSPCGFTANGMAAPEGALSLEVFGTRGRSVGRVWATPTPGEEESVRRTL